MTVEYKTTRISAVKTTTAIIGVFEDETPEFLDKNALIAFKNLKTLGDFKAKSKTHVFLYLEKSDFKRILLIGLGDKKSFDFLKLKEIVGKIPTFLKNIQNKNAAVFLESFLNKKMAQEEVLKNFILFLDDAFYSFEYFKKEENKTNISEIFFALTVENKEIKNILNEAKAISAGVHLAKDLGNFPANICTPEFLTKEAEKIAENKNVTLNIYDQKYLKKEGLNALLSVAKGSNLPPFLIHLEYGKKYNNPIVLIGKGVCFDSGGISLKPAAGMDEMKFDMCGAASVLGVFLAVTLLQLPVHLHVLVPAVENMPSGTATHPGDVVKSLSGQTIEIINTDAEGRLILCDALTFAERFKPAVVIDVATLTGACIIALGNVASGLLTNHQKLADSLIAAGEKTQDRFWQLPLFDDYQKLLDSPIADMSNSGGREAGTISAACFLSRFAKKFHWAHLDIAGTAWISGKNKTATGRPVAALFQFIKDSMK